MHKINPQQNPQQRTINDSIKDLITSRLNEQPKNTLCTITHIYPDEKVDIQTDTYGEIKYIDTITPHNTGDKSVLIFLNNDLNQRIVI